MKTKNQTSSIRMAVCALLLLALCLSALTACFSTPATDPDAPLYTEDVTLGEGATTFTLRVVADDLSVLFTIHTNKTVLGDALTEHGLVEGEESTYGLYVKRVNNILADYDVDGSWWCLYINGEMAASGVDTTEIVDGTSYEFRKEK